MHKANELQNASTTTEIKIVSWNTSNTIMKFTNLALQLKKHSRMKKLFLMHKFNQLKDVKTKLGGYRKMLIQISLAWYIC